jgi:hypothetical protein
VLDLEGPEGCQALLRTARHCPSSPTPGGPQPTATQHSATTSPTSSAASTPGGQTTCSARWPIPSAPPSSGSADQAPGYPRRIPRTGRKRAWNYRTREPADAPVKSSPGSSPSVIGIRYEPTGVCSVSPTMSSPPTMLVGPCLVRRTSGSGPRC